MRKRKVLYSPSITPEKPAQKETRTCRHGSTFKSKKSLLLAQEKICQSIIYQRYFPFYIKILFMYIHILLSHCGQHSHLILFLDPVMYYVGCIHCDSYIRTSLIQHVCFNQTTGSSAPWYDNELSAFVQFVALYRESSKSVWPTHKVVFWGKCADAIRE